MKILHTIYDDVDNPWCGGGGALRTLKIARQLSSRHEITMLVGSFPGSKKSIEIEGVNIIRLGIDRSYFLSRASYTASASIKVAQSEFDLWVYGFSAYAPLQVSRSIRNRSLLELFHLMGVNAKEKFPLLGHIAQRAERQVLKLHPQILTISPTVSTQLDSLNNKSKKHVVYTGIDDICFQAEAKENDYILYFGRLDIHTKGLDILLRAMSYLSNRNVRLIIAGRGTPQRQRTLSELADSLGVKNQIEIFGPADVEQKNQLIGGALFVCMPSRYEGWGIVAIEAGAAGKAVIGTNIAGLRDAIRHNETGLLVPTEDPNELSRAIAQLLENPTQRQNLGKAGRRWAKRFTWERVASDQEKVYKSISQA